VVVPLPVTLVAKPLNLKVLLLVFTVRVPLLVKLPFKVMGMDAEINVLPVPTTKEPLTLNFAVNNSFGTSPQVTLSQATTATNLTLTTGQLTTTPANLLTIAFGGSISGGSSSSFVNGPLAQVYSATGSKTFPLGDYANSTANYRAVALNMTTLGTLPSTITVTPNVPSTWNAAHTPANTTMFGTRDWTVASSAASGDVCTLTLNGTDFSPSGIGKLIDWNGTATSSLANIATAPSYSAAGISLTTSSDFALGDYACTPPTAHNVTGGGNYCSGGTGVPVGLDNSDTGVNYQLYIGAVTAVGSPIAGSTGSAINFGNQTNAGTYTVLASTGGDSTCASSMTGSAVVSIDNPAATTNPTGQSVISGQTATFTVSAGSTTGPTYQWEVSTNLGGTWNNVSTGVGGTTASYTTPATTIADSGTKFRCIVTGTSTCGTTTATSTARLLLSPFRREICPGRPFRTSSRYRIRRRPRRRIRRRISRWPGAVPTAAGITAE